MSAHTAPTVATRNLTVMEAEQLTVLNVKVDPGSGGRWVSWEPRKGIVFSPHSLWLICSSSLNVSWKLSCHDCVMSRHDSTARLQKVTFPSPSYCVNKLFDTFCRRSSRVCKDVFMILLPLMFFWGGICVASFIVGCHAGDISKIHISVLPTLIAH